MDQSHLVAHPLGVDPAGDQEVGAFLLSYTTCSATAAWLAAGTAAVEPLPQYTPAGAVLSWYSTPLTENSNRQT